MKGLFITGTDTGVGKTLVTAGLVGALSSRGTRIGVMKPVQSGGVFSNGELVSEDAKILMRASGLDPPLAWVNPYCFEPAISPDLAAGKTEVSIDLIKERLNLLAAGVDIVFVEGAGGIASPLLKGKTNGDVASELGLPVIIVSPQRLGTINHTVMTVEYCRDRGIDVIGVILNNRKKPDSDPDNEKVRQTNGVQIQFYGNVEILGELSHVEYAANDRSLTELIERTTDNVDLDYILERI